MKTIPKLLLVVSLCVNIMFIYNYVKQYNRPTSVRRILVFPTSTNNSKTRPVKATFSERQNKDQFTFQGARSLIVGAYSEALQVKEFARKYFSKDLDLTTKSALEEDYSRNYLPFKDLTRKIQALVDAIYSQYHDNLTILGDLVQKRIQKLQNPSDCKTAKKLICKFPRCGLGCQFHHIGNCLLVALGTNRVRLVNNKNVHYKGIEKVFLPLSKTCSSEDISMKVVELLGGRPRPKTNIKRIFFSMFSNI
ncbi:alpha-(1,6)-fucosyltransferase-like isoform X2 [Clavelina lepadiformis]|uniref:alpha-(1,6)-fucosyltransferase-like isoform X2 n=1 Tax=Clavelina lepadiformis TaxID=159417 RepID=UPI004041283A